MVKKVFFIASCLFSACFAQLEVIETKQTNPKGFFFGAGLGVGANAMKFAGDSYPSNKMPYEENRSYASLVVSAKVGGYYYFSQMIGLRYYYNLDLNYNPSEEVSPPFSSFYVLSGSHTLNADAIVNVFASKNFQVALIGGIGMGVLAGEFGTRYKSVYNASNNNFVDFDFRFNLGTRIMFDQKYGIELMAKLPVIPSTQIYGDNINYGKSSPYYFTIDFVMERF